MNLSMLQAVEPSSISDGDKRAAQEASRALAQLGGRGSVHVEAEAANGSHQTFVLPAAAVRLLTDMLVHLAAGRVVSVLPENAELTTRQAADMLNVSRPHLVKLMGQGLSTSIWLAPIAGCGWKTSSPLRHVGIKTQERRWVS